MSLLRRLWKWIMPRQPPHLMDPAAAPQRPYWSQGQVVRDTVTGEYYIYDDTVPCLSRAPVGVVLAFPGPGSPDYTQPLPSIVLVDEAAPPRRPLPPPSPRFEPACGEVVYVHEADPLDTVTDPGDRALLLRLRRDIAAVYDARTWGQIAREALRAHHETRRQGVDIDAARRMRP
jgi:hypothetical protein